MTSSSSQVQLALAREAADVVLGDLHRTTDLRPTVAVDLDEWEQVRVWIKGGYSIVEIGDDLADASAAMADYFQDELAWQVGAWPLCDADGLGLHGEVHDGVPVWWCRFGGHGVTRIGELGSSGF